MFFASLKPLVRSLHFRLLLLYSAVMVATVVICLVVVHEGIRLACYDLVDDFLREELDDVCRELRASPANVDRSHDALARRAKHHPRRKLFIQLISPDGNVRWASPHSPDGAESVAGFNRPVTRGDYRFVQKSLTLATGESETVRVGVSLNRLRDEMRLYTVMMLLAGGCCLAAAPVSGFFLASRATHPFARIVETTNQIVPQHLEQRLPLLGTNGIVDHLSSTINRLLDQLQEHLELNRRWIADAAHELRSPLAALRASLEVALNAERSAEEYQEIIEGAIQECDNVTDLVNKLLLLAEGDGGMLRIRHDPVSMPALIDRAVQMYQAVAESRDVRLGVREIDTVVVPGEAPLLALLLQNLLDNAVKFTPPSGSVTVTLTRGPDQTRAVLRVTDTGIGIPAEDQARLFQRFYRGDRSRPRGAAQGHGLGLSVCQTIVQAHGGTIDIVSGRGSGSVFAVTLPALPAAANVAFHSE